MTIAASVVVRPSKTLLQAVRAMALAAMLAAFLIFFQSCDLSSGIRLQIFAIVSIFAGYTVFNASFHRKTFHIDISGIGQIRLTQYSGVSASDENRRVALDGHSGLVVHLTLDSVLWPQFLLLRLKPDQGPVISIIVFPNSMGRTDFADLSVACRYIATRNANAEMID